MWNSSLQINTNQGRYELTSSGDLQIVQVHKTDSGTYVCVADNGIGEPVQREIQLHIAGKSPLSTSLCILVMVFDVAQSKHFQR